MIFRPCQSRKIWLELNSKKQMMVVSRNNESPKNNIFINRMKSKSRDQFKFFGTLY